MKMIQKTDSNWIPNCLVGYINSLLIKMSIAVQDLLAYDHVDCCQNLTIVYLLIRKSILDFVSCMFLPFKCTRRPTFCCILNNANIYGFFLEMIKYVVPVAHVAFLSIMFWTVYTNVYHASINRLQSFCCYM